LHKIATEIEPLARQIKAANWKENK
jgi:hypothetical protein